ncbi:release factor glutamine methyltransferase [Salegentibacter echinorum]|uniref:peptide chain release factor N(5)-glutamine methyltransferase n=1 Tax=Salegentibacter echinorum TaxID=1073325 RepID=A0A1M5F6T3_SALEC|nr:peptide chain release factor N(5)-glutamine methyltransferase [Salegentibacter echinorum]SHF87108.1 release factor glutamine methyltransferase [Salegentibacter echinorum]
MKLNILKEEFCTALLSDYPAEEAHSFFFMLTQAYFKVSRLDLALNPNIEIDATEADKLEQAKLRLLQHEPIQHILGTTEFFSLNFQVSKDVLIPRPETEELVQWILDDVSANDSTIKLTELGTGSGCIAISLAKSLSGSKISAVDISEKALKIAKLNANKNEVFIDFSLQDILELEQLPENQDVIVSNPPYVRELEKKAMQRNVLDYEPEQALYVADHDPLIFYKQIANLAKKSLIPDGKLYFEINQYLAAETEKLLQDQGFTTELRKDIFGNYRMLKGIKQ